MRNKEIQAREGCRRKKSTGTPCKVKLCPQWKATVLPVQEGEGKLREEVKNIGDFSDDEPK